MEYGTQNQIVDITSVGIDFDIEDIEGISSRSVF